MQIVALQIRFNWIYNTHSHTHTPLLYNVNERKWQPNIDGMHMIAICFTSHSHHLTLLYTFQCGAMATATTPSHHIKHTHTQKDSHLVKWLNKLNSIGRSFDTWFFHRNIRANWLTDSRLIAKSNSHHISKWFEFVASDLHTFSNWSRIEFEHKANKKKNRPNEIEKFFSSKSRF